MTLKSLVNIDNGYLIAHGRKKNPLMGQWVNEQLKKSFSLTNGGRNDQIC